MNSNYSNSNESNTGNNGGTTSVHPVPFWKALVTETDWNSPQILESWYGHHSPFLRALALTFIFRTITSLSELIHMYLLVKKETIGFRTLGATLSAKGNSFGDRGIYYVALMTGVIPMSVTSAVFDSTGFLIDTMLNLLLPTILIRLCFTWPKENCGGVPITFGSTFKMLLLLCTLSPLRPAGEEAKAIIVFFAGLSTMAAYYYKNNSAAIEWLRLGVLSFIPGVGWWKLVYIFWRAFPRRAEAEMHSD